MVRNTLAILFSLAVSAAIIIFSVMINEYWIKFEYRGLPIEHWRAVLANARGEFFLALLTASGVASFVGGILCASLVTKARIPYAMLIGFILLLVAIADLIIFHGHPFWYKVSIFFVFYPFSWLGAQVVKSIYKLRKRYSETHHS